MTESDYNEFREFCITMFQSKQAYAKWSADQMVPLPLDRDSVVLEICRMVPNIPAILVYEVYDQHFGGDNKKRKARNMKKIRKMAH